MIPLKDTQEQVDGLILADAYHVFPDTTTTVCYLTLKNGFTVLGKSACIVPANFDAALERKLAYEDAKRKIWELEGYALAERLSQKE